jgi:ABC-type sugar transport system substrate-binding protein
MRHPLFSAAAAALSALFLLISGLWPVTGETAPKRLVIALVLDTDLGVYPAALRSGALTAADALDADLSVVVLPEAEARQRQTALVKDQLAQGADAILLLSADERVVREAQRLCEAKGAKLVLVDACEAQRGNTPYVGTDHAASGVEAARMILAISKARTLLVLSRGDPVSAERLAGIRAHVTGTGAKTVVCVRATHATPDDWWVREMIRGNPEAEAILCLDGTLSECAARALKSLGLEGRALGGFDVDQARVGILTDGSIRFTVLREPFAIGYEAVKRAGLLIEGKAPPPAMHIASSVILCEDALKAENIPIVFPLIQ